MTGAVHQGPGASGDRSIAERDPQLWAGLMMAAQDGNGAAYARLLGEILPFLRSVVRRSVPVNDVEDVVQDVLLTMHTVRHTYDPARPLEPWLVGIARRRSADHYRRFRRSADRELHVQGGVENLATGDAKDEVEARDAARNVRAAIGKLPDRQRSAMELLKLKELSLDEASRASGLSVGALKVAAHRAYRSLRRKLEDE